MNLLDVHKTSVVRTIPSSSNCLTRKKKLLSQGNMFMTFLKMMIKNNIIDYLKSRELMQIDKLTE